MSIRYLLRSRVLTRLSSATSVVRPMQITGHPTTAVRFKSTKKSASGVSSGKDKRFQDLIDSLDDDDDDDDRDGEGSPALKEERTVFRDTPVAEFIYGYHSNSTKKTTRKMKGHKGKNPSTHHDSADYFDVKRMIDIESYWSEMTEINEEIQSYLANQASLRSANALDSLPVELEGEFFPLHEIATISKKDARRIVIDCSSFPTAASSVVRAISESNLNLNPHQDGTKVSVPIPKITREYREKLAQGAKEHFQKTKDAFRKTQNKFIADFKNKALDPSCRLPREKLHSVEEIIMAVGHQFTVLSEHTLKTKQQEILGKLK